MTPRTWIAVGAVIARWGRGACHTPPPPPAPVRIATFNIEDFPKSPGQAPGAADVIAQTGALILAVQEINEPDVLLAAVRGRLGDRWEGRFVDGMPVGSRFPPPHLGGLYDAARWKMLSSTVHDQRGAGNRRHDRAARRLSWASEPLPCSALWDRDDGCARSRLDHVLTSVAPRDITAGRAWATDGCDRK